jgi:hypothetical protein
VAGASEVMVVATVVPVLPLYALTDDVDREFRAAQEHPGSTIDIVARAGIKATGRADIGQPMRCLVYGLRELQAMEDMMLRGGERGWEGAEQFAECVWTEVGSPVTEAASTPTATRTA